MPGPLTGALGRRGLLPGQGGPRARAELFLVGGAALAVAYDATRATRDLMCMTTARSANDNHTG